MSSSRVPVTVEVEIEVYEPTGHGTETRQLFFKDVPKSKIAQPVNPKTNDPRVNLVKEIVKRGLNILQTAAGLRALKELAKAIITQRRTRKLSLLYPDDDKELSKLDVHLRRFLALLRSDFPELYLTNLPGEAAAKRYAWVEPGTKITDYKPREAGHMELNAMLVHSATYGSLNTRKTCTFALVLSFCHEIGHLLTGYLCGMSRPGTPPRVKVPGLRSEAGYYWEYIALGGVVEFYSSIEDRTNPNQAGTPYFFPNGWTSAQGQSLSSEYMENFLLATCGSTLKVPASALGAEFKTRVQLQRECTPMSKLRNMGPITTPMDGAPTGRRGGPSRTSEFRSRLPLWQPMDHYDTFAHYGRLCVERQGHHRQ